jgi:tetratricopeptide (TPR) repeat protein
MGSPGQAQRFDPPGRKGFPAYVDHENVRLFRRDPRIYFVGRVHESVGPRIEELGLRLGHAQFHIHHFGLTAGAEARARKSQFYRDLGKLKVREMPRNAQAYLELGLAEMENLCDIQEALACFTRACELNPRLGVAWFFAGIAQFRLGQHCDALHCLRQAENSGHATPFVAETIGDAHYNLGDFPKAALAYKRALRRSHDSPLLESKLGLAIVRTGQAEDGLEKIRRSAAQRPELAELHDRLILSLVWLGRIPEAAQAAEDKLRSVKAAPSGDFLRAASLWAKLENWARATAVLHVGLQVYPQNTALTKAFEELKARGGAQVHDLAATLNSALTVTTSR